MFFEKWTILWYKLSNFDVAKVKRFKDVLIWKQVVGCSQGISEFKMKQDVTKLNLGYQLNLTLNLWRDTIAYLQMKICKKCSAFMLNKVLMDEKLL